VIAPPYVIEHQISMKEVVATYRYLHATYNRIGYALGIAVMASGVLAALVGEWLWATYGLLVGAFTVWEAATSTVDGWLMKRRLRGVLGGMSKSVIDGEGIKFDDPTTSGIVRWDRLTSLVETDQIILLLRDGTAVVRFPTSAFHDASERNAVVQFMRAQISAAQANRA
jgi:hypothetical protein